MGWKPRPTGLSQVYSLCVIISRNSWLLLQNNALMLKTWRCQNFNQLLSVSLKEVAKTIREHLWGILNAIVLKVSNGPAEGLNSR